VDTQRIWVVVDVHEGARPPALLEDLGASVTTENLRAGDYLLGAGAVVERKTVKDLHLTLIEGRLWAQIGLIRRYARPYLLVEGSDLDDGPVSSGAIRGALLAVMDQQIGLIRSRDLGDSTEWLYRLARRRQRHRRSGRPMYAQRPSARTTAQAAEALLAAVPGISFKTARSLLQRFGTIRAILAAQPEEWRTVPGIGEIRARYLTETLDQAASSDPPLP
jgi:ERCC4-type nuclease